MRIASFNVENLDEGKKAGVPLEERVPLLRPQLERLRADVLCLQEVNGQRLEPGAPRQLHALAELLRGTPYERFEQTATLSLSGRGAADIHNLVICARQTILESREIRHDYIAPPHHRRVTADPPEEDAAPIEWDRPLQYAALELDGGGRLHLFNAHLRAPLAAAIPGGKKSAFVWKSVGGWAEGYFMAGIKRTGQALELRLAVEEVFDADPDALIAVCGDFNAEDHETAMRIVIGAEEDTSSGRLAGRALTPLERSLPRDRRYSVLHHGKPMMLDHILVSRRLLGAFRALEVHNETLEDELVAFARVERAPDSYHAPVVAEFDL